jgi:hypothetical protein
VVATGERTARAAGVACGRAKTSDIVDAVVVVTAVRLAAPVVTDDPTDLRQAASALLHFGASDLGYLAAREALRLAVLASDPLRVAAVHCSLAHVLMRQGRFLDAERISVAAAEQVEPTGQASPAQLSIFGGLVLRGATAAARQRRAGAATDLLAEATTAAQRIGVDRTPAAAACAGR